MLNEEKPLVEKVDDRYRINTANPFSVRAGAFGCGEHETTLACLNLVETLVKPGMTVLDVGTGTGILAIAASKAGASRVLAYDIEKPACDVAAMNAADNGVTNVRIVQSDGAAIEGAYDVVLANIYADILARLPEKMTRWVVPGGHAVLSGIPVEDNFDIRRRYIAAGFTVAANMIHTDFSTVHLIR